jgi:outer membrane receptor for Fe3+-dicitrate
MFRLLFALICSLGTLTCVAHDNLIKGHVTDSVSGIRLIGAYLILDRTNETQATDALGNFRFDGLADGTYILKCTFIGYNTQTFSIVVKGDETKTLNIKLSPSTLNLDEVVVTSASTPQETMTTINKIDIGLRPFKSSQDVLRMIPGLVTAQHAGGGKAEQIFLRGFDIDHGTDITLTVDGMPVNMVSHAHGQGYADLHFVVPELIDYVNFNKGPYYSSVGDFNTAGFANFQTRKSLDKNSVKIEAGRFDTYRAVGLFNILNDATKNQHAYLAAEYLYTNGPFVSPQNFNRLNLFGKFAGKISDDKFFTASLSTFKSEWDASGQIPERAISRGLLSRFGSLDDTEGGFTGRSNANFSLIKFNEDGSSFKNQVYVSNYNFELYSNFTFYLNDPVNGDEIKQKENRNIYGYNGSYQKEIHLAGKHLQSEFGVGLRYDDVSGNELSHVKARYTFINPLSLGDVDQINSSAYADFRYNLSARLVANAGIRFDAFSFQYSDKLNTLYDRKSETATIVSPKLSFFYNANSNFQIYLKSGYGFHSNDSRVVVAQQAEDILPKAFGADLGFFAKPSKSLLVNFALWHLKLEQEFVYVGDEAIVEPSGETQRHGVDLSIRYQALDWLYLDFDGNYANGRSVNEPDGKNYIPLAPRFTSIAGLTANLKNGFHGSLRYRWVGGRPANEDNTVVAKGYFLLDVAMTYTRRTFEVSLAATNLTNIKWNEAQFDTETLIPGDAESVSELTFTPGDPLFLKAGIRFFF